MPVVQPPAPRFEVEDLSDSTMFQIRSRKHWLSMFYFGFVILFSVWAVALFGNLAVVSFYKLVFNLNPPWLAANVRVDADWTSVVFGAIMAVLFASAMAWMLVALLWQLSGPQIIQVSNRSLTLRRQILAVSRPPKEYLAEHVKSLRVESLDFPYFGWHKWFGYRGYLFGTESGTIAFDYGARTFRFGDDLDNIEARKLLDHIQKRFPQYS